MAQDKVAIIGGTGDLGLGLALRWAAAGVHIVIGSREAAKAEEAAAKVRSAASKVTVEGMDNVQAAASAPLVVLTVPFGAQAAVLKSIKPSLKDCVLVDCTVPLAVALGGRVTRLLGVWEGSAAQQARGLVPKEIPVLAAFHNVSAELLQQHGASLDCDILVCGDDAPAKQKLFPLIERIDGLRPVDAGPLEMARLVEGLTPLLIGLNIRNKGAHAGIRITGI
jgi:8-hydroxy-5-deazaflavin:NADPH oxidoreductase